MSQDDFQKETPLIVIPDGPAELTPYERSSVESSGVRVAVNAESPVLDFRTLGIDEKEQ